MLGNIICFIIGSWFGMGIFAVLSYSRYEDEERNKDSDVNWMMNTLNLS